MSKYDRHVQIISGRIISSSRPRPPAFVWMRGQIAGRTFRSHEIGLAAAVQGQVKHTLERAEQCSKPWFMISSGIKLPTGWWFGTFFIFPYIGNNHPN